MSNASDAIPAALFYNRVVQPIGYEPPPYEPVRTPRDQVRDIISDITARWEIDRDTLFRVTHSRVSAHPRQELMYRLRTEIRMSFPKIANFIAEQMGVKNFHHTTVMYGCVVHEKRIREWQGAQQKNDDAVHSVLSEGCA